MNNENNTAQELFAQLGVVLDEIVKKKDIAVIVEQFVDSFKSLHTKINEKMAENKDRGNEVKEKSRPEPGIDIQHHRTN